MNDLHFALRQLLKAPGFSAVAIVTLALGIGVNTTVFSWTSSVLLRPIHGVSQPEQLMTLETIAPNGDLISSSYPDFRDYLAQAQSLSGVIAFDDRPLSFGPDDQAHRVWAELVSGNFFDVLGVRPVAGRFFSAEEQEEAPGKHPVVVLSVRFWERHFNRDPGVIGQTIRLNRKLFTVVGVAPAEFAGTIVGLSFDVWVPLMMESSLTGGNVWLENRKSRGLHLMVRLKPEASAGEARAEIRAIAQRLAATHPDSNERVGATLLRIDQAPYGAQSHLGALLHTLLGAGGVVMLIVCANVANMLLARATSRRKEFGVRLALGASRGRIIRQLLVESLVLAGVGGGLGILLAVVLKDYFRVFVPVTHLPVVLEFPLDGWVLVFTLLVSVCAGLMFGLAPALQTARQSSWGNLTESSRGTTPGARSHRLRGLLVISEVALALVALTGAGLFLHSFQRARTMDPGFQTANVLLATLNLSEQGYTREQGKLFLRRARERIEAIPGVKVASFAEDVPLGFDGGSWEYVEVPGYVPQRGESMTILRNPVAPRYFELMGIPLMEGREFADQDDTNAAPVMVINETFARRYLAGVQPIGRAVRIWGKAWTIVGVARDIKYATLNERAQPYFYVPLAQFYRPELGLGLHVRTIGPPASVLPAVRRELKALDPAVQLFETLTLTEYIGAAWFAQKVAATLLTALGALALLLASIGLFSVMAYTVNQRTHEIGIRMALGARAADVVRMILRDGLRLAFSGMALGLAASFALTPLVSSQLLGIGANDPFTFVGVSLLLFAVVACACFIPARRAARVDPMVALRND